MTFNEAKAALAIGCKVYKKNWTYSIYVISINTNANSMSVMDRKGEIREYPITRSHICSTNWEIYHEY